METPLLAPIDYLKPPSDPWPRIFRILAIASMVFGAFYALAALGSLRTAYRMLQLSNTQTTGLRYWGPISIPVIDLLVGLGIVVGAVMLLRNHPYEQMIRSLRFIVVVTLLSMCIGIYKTGEFLSWQYLVYSVGAAAKVVSFPLLVILILLSHRKAHPQSPLAAKPKPPSLGEEPLPLLRR